MVRSIGSQLLGVTAKREIIISVLYGIGKIELTTTKKKLVMMPRTKKFLFWDLTAVALQWHCVTLSSNPRVNQPDDLHRAVSERVPLM